VSGHEIEQLLQEAYATPQAIAAEAGRLANASHSASH